MNQYDILLSKSLSYLLSKHSDSIVVPSPLWVDLILSAATIDLGDRRQFCVMLAGHFASVRLQQCANREDSPDPAVMAERFAQAEDTDRSMLLSMVDGWDCEMAFSSRGDSMVRLLLFFVGRIGALSEFGRDMLTTSARSIEVSLNR